ncbi:MAG: helix-turn-helix transcriptional regulator [Lachnospiraceae bacterium]|nr:helix-turn-helix transcriptional regulator [Lachnospiraceae bacterium]
MNKIKKDINIQIGQRVKKVRHSRNLTREQLSEKLGISTLFMGYIECGQKGMSLSTLQNVCTTLRVSADYILLGIESENDKRSSAEALLNSLDDDYIPLAEESLKNLISLIEMAEQKNT